MPRPNRRSYFRILSALAALLALADPTVWTTAGAASANNAAGQFAFRTDAFSEGFDNVSTLPSAGWSVRNNSEPAGTSGWFQGNPTSFPAQSGPTASYIAANFNNTAGNGTISNWLFTPVYGL
ncbi:MAG: choice-of-anchor J domain-containing protein [Pyrinomonadaceae bacterium]